MLCERCKEEIYAFEIRNYCDRKICRSCVKSSRRPEKKIRLVICKDCWSNNAKRLMYKRGEKPKT